MDGFHDGAEHVVRLIDLHGVLLGKPRIALLMHARLWLRQHIWHHSQREWGPQQALRLQANITQEQLSCIHLSCIALGLLWPRQTIEGLSSPTSNARAPLVPESKAVGCML